jgi:nucleoside-diphosphate-sugar epimerase
MRVCVIGGTGHIGKFLCPALVAQGHEVTALARGVTPVPAGGGWEKVRRVACSYQPGPELEGLMGELAPEALVDIMGFGGPGVWESIARGLPGSCRQVVACGSVWMWGDPAQVPTPEAPTNRCWAEGYAWRFDLYQRLQGECRARGLAFTVIMPPNICGPYKVPLEGKGGRSPEVHREHERGEPCPLPAPGNNPVGPCDAEDVAQGFGLALEQPERAEGEFFNVGSAYALTAERFVAVYGELYGTTIPIEWVSWEDYSTRINPDRGANYHFSAPMCPDITKIRNRLGYAPRYTPEESMARAVAWMREEG